MGRALVVCALLLVALPARADWSRTDTALELTYAALHLADWSQTIHIARNPAGTGESNPILGNRPPEGRVHAYFATTLALHAGVAYLLPRGWRHAWQSTWIIIEGAQVHTNRRIFGVGFALP